MISLSRPYRFKIFKRCLPQILLGPFLNTLTHLLLEIQNAMVGYAIPILEYNIEISAYSTANFIPLSQSYYRYFYMLAMISKYSMSFIEYQKLHSRVS